MKVDVITVNEATFKRWCWWSDWIDVAVFGYGCKAYLLQMRVSRTNKKNFAVRGVQRRYWANGPSIIEIGDLTQMKRGERS